MGLVRGFHPFYYRERCVQERDYHCDPLVLSCAFLFTFYSRILKGALENEEQGKIVTTNVSVTVRMVCSLIFKKKKGGGDSGRLAYTYGRRTVTPTRKTGNVGILRS